MDKITRFFFNIHEDLPRQGPGTFDATARALRPCRCPP
jgi:hypothetical protein